MTDAATPEAATAPQVHDLASAARAIEKITRREEPSAVDSEDAHAAVVSSREEQDEDPGIEAGDEPDEDSGASDDEDEDEDDGAEREPRYKVKAGGEETEVTLKELIKGYQRGADYTRKTTRLAEERRGIESAKADLEAERTAVALDRQRYAGRLEGRIPALQQQLAQFKGIDWDRLSAENPELFAQAKPLFDSLTGQ